MSIVHFEVPELLAFVSSNLASRTSHEPIYSLESGNGVSHCFNRPAEARKTFPPKALPSLKYESVPGSDNANADAVCRKAIQCFDQAFAYGLTVRVAVCDVCALFPTVTDT